MQKVIGVICLVAGVLLAVWGYNVAQSVGGQVSRIWSGSVVARSCQLSFSAGRLAPGAHGNTCHPRSAAASAQDCSPGSARLALATLTEGLIPSNR